MAIALLDAVEIDRSIRQVRPFSLDPEISLEIPWETASHTLPWGKVYMEPNLQSGKLLPCKEASGVGLRLQLVRDGKVVRQWPLDPEGLSRRRFDEELRRLRRRRAKLMEFFDTFSNENRWDMMCRLIDSDDFALRYSDLSGDFNPKSIREHLGRLMQLGFVAQERRGDYHLSPFGQVGLFATLCALMDVLDALRGEYEER